MGNYRFKLSDMIPNAWFYKLRDMGKARKQTQIQTRKKKQSSPASTTQTKSSKPKKPHQCNIPRKSYYFTRELNPSDRIHTSPANIQNTSDTNFPQQPRKSSKQRPKKRTPRTSSPKPNCSCRNTTLESMSTKSNSPPEYSSSSSPVDSSGESEFPEPEFRTDRVLPTESFDDIIIDVDNNSIARKGDKLDGCDPFSGLVLPPIVTKPAKFNDLLSDAKKQEAKPRSRMAAHEELNVKGSLKVKIVKEDTAASMKEHRNTPCRRFSVSSPGVRLRINSPRVGVGSRRAQAHGRKSVSAGSGSRRSLSDSFAIVKSSFNPQRDFRESMVEMIVQNNIRTSKDLEDLLACYLSLNSDEYHSLIIKVFKQIWFDLTDNM